MINDLTAEAEVGRTYTGKVVRIEEYGAFVEIMPNLVGLMHVSEIAHYRVKSVRDILKLGQIINVKVLNIETDGKIRLSMKALVENPNPEAPAGSEGPPREGGDRDGDSRYHRKPQGSHDHRRDGRGRR
jgi:polyribonucleotide nucleotidyltransferase